MKERPVIFNSEMVRAILSGRKTQTRRAISDRHLHLIDVASRVGECYPLESGIDHANSQSYYREYCPFGQAGDRLWVRETFGDCGNRLVYRADTEDGAASQVKCWVPSIHMPREACRILLEITAVRVERLNDISEEDAKAEGVKAGVCPGHEHMMHQVAFSELWQSIYGAESWRANPWVWVIEFRRVG
ncbi:hypothetical protein, partial [Serratia marcescens]